MTQFDDLVFRDLRGYSNPEDLATLKADPRAWYDALQGASSRAQDSLATVNEALRDLKAKSLGSGWSYTRFRNESVDLDTRRRKISAQWRKIEAKKREVKPLVSNQNRSEHSQIVRQERDAARSALMAVLADYADGDGIEKLADELCEVFPDHADEIRFAARMRRGT